LVLQLINFVNHFVPELFCCFDDRGCIGNILISTKEKLPPCKRYFCQPKPPAPAHISYTAGITGRYFFERMISTQVPAIYERLDCSRSF
ncbi:hypothetical protein, partial [Intestinimonas butyriciproducens]|uniref:hypothetical protein n=1 Tax=Intestinimonas butyriciproducens TaxID=1297617 RepID=UPI0034A584E6